MSELLGNYPNLAEINYEHLGEQIYYPEYRPLRVAVERAYLENEPAALAAELLTRRPSEAKKISKISSVLIADCQAGEYRVGDKQPEAQLAFCLNSANVDYLLGQAHADRGEIDRLHTHYFLHAGDNAAFAARHLVGVGRYRDAGGALDLAVRAREGAISNLLQRPGADSVEVFNSFIDIPTSIRIAFDPWVEAIKQADSIEPENPEQVTPPIGYRSEFYHELNPYLWEASAAMLRGFAYMNEVYRQAAPESSSKQQLAKSADFFGNEVIWKLASLGHTFSFLYLSEVMDDVNRKHLSAIEAMARSPYRHDLPTTVLAVTGFQLAKALALLQTMSVAQNTNTFDEQTNTFIGRGLTEVVQQQDLLHAAWGIVQGSTDKLAKVREIYKVRNHDKIALLKQGVAEFKSSFRYDSAAAPYKALLDRILKAPIRAITHLELFQPARIPEKKPRK
jgi:hypothetical protein